ANLGPLFCLSLMVHLISWNINGCGSPIKRKRVLTYLKGRQVDVAFVQETHFKDVEERLQFVLKGEFKDKEGRIICIDALINGIKVVPCNIYAPNKEYPDFINELNKVLAPSFSFHLTFPLVQSAAVHTSL
uniref:Endonuclease/exonuclease/phosphatase domain-containing protein n=1 Tax=Labrus bergylta TaxID=56723 RepID=A0A3Q3LTK5_9LABR